MFKSINLLCLLLLMSAGSILSAQEYHLALGEKHLSNGDLEKSITVLNVAKDSFLLSKNDTAVALCYNLLAKANLHQGKYKSSIAFNEEGLKYARRAPYSTAYLQLLLFKSEYNFMKGNTEVGRDCWREIKDKMVVKNNIAASAYKAFASAYLYEPNDTFKMIAQKGLEIALQFKDSTQIANAYRLLSDRSQILADIPNAIAYSLAGLKYAPSSNPIIKANYFLLLSNCFQSLDDNIKALFYAEQAEAMLTSTRYQLFKHKVFNKLAQLHAEIGNIQLAENYWGKSLAFYREKNNLNNIAGIFTIQLSIYLASNEQEKIKEAFYNVISIDLSKIKIENQNFAHRTLTKYYFSKKEFSFAKKELEKWRKTKDEIVEPENQSEYLYYKSLLSEYDSRYDESISYLKASNKLKDSIKRKKQSDVVYLLEAEYNMSRKEAEIDLLESQSKLKNLKVVQRNAILFLCSIFLAIVAFLTYIFFKRNQKVKVQKNKISKALKEKNILLEEIHSRVKNSLQTISSILSLQSRTMENGIAAEAIKEGQNRVNSMAIIHDNLYLENNKSQVNIKSYIDQLLDALFKSYNVTPDKIKLEKKIMSGVVDVDKIIPIGLIINELISNALKHAFAEKDNGIIKVEFLKIEDLFQLAVTDNGIGISPDQQEKDKGFGSRIILAFAKKLNANVTRTTGSGTSVVVSFSNLK